MAKAKTPKQLERHFKGVANHRRIEILFVIARTPKISVEGISEELNVNMKTISGHTKRLVDAGLVNKKYRGQVVEHSLSPYGRTFLRFIQTFSSS